MDIIKDINLEVILKPTITKYKPLVGNIVKNDNVYFIITNIDYSDKYNKEVFHCRKLQSTINKIYDANQLEVITFLVEVYHKEYSNNSFIGTFPLDFNSIEKLCYTKYSQTVKGHIETFKRKARVGDNVIYPCKGVVHAITPSTINILEDDSCISTMLDRNHITLANKDTNSILKLICPICGN